MEAVRNAAVAITMVPTIAAIEKTMPRALPALPDSAIWRAVLGEGIAETAVLAQSLGLSKLDKIERDSIRS